MKKKEKESATEIKVQAQLWLDQKSNFIKSNPQIESAAISDSMKRTMESFNYGITNMAAQLRKRRTWESVVWSIMLQIIAGFLHSFSHSTKVVHFCEVRLQEAHFLSYAIQKSFMSVVFLPQNSGSNSWEKISYSFSFN